MPFDPTPLIGAAGKLVDAEKRGDYKGIAITKADYSRKKKAALSGATTDEDKVKAARFLSGEDSESNHDINIIKDLGWDSEDCQHFKLNINGREIIIKQEPDEIMHPVDDASDLLDKHYDEIKDVIASYHQSKGAEGAEDAEEEHDEDCPCQACEWEKATSHADMRESSNITNFLKAISQKNYAQADKYLQDTVDSRIKASISNAIKNSK